MTSQKVLFITTKNLDYIRNTQEISMLNEEFDIVDIIGSNQKKYIARLMYVYSHLLFKQVRGYDEVFVGFAPQLIIPLFKCKFKHNRVVIDFFISFYDTLVFDRQKFSKNSRIASIIKKIDRKTLAVADEIIADTNEHAKYFAYELGADRKKITVKYLEADHTIYYPHRVERPKRFRNKNLVLYFGSVLPLQGVDVILNTIELMKNEENIHFIIIGPIKAELKKPIQSNVTYMNWVSQQELSDYIAMADLCLAGHFNATIAKAARTIPGKAYSYRAVGKPIVLGDNPANRELYHESMDGIYYTQMGQPEALAKTIKEVFA